MPRVQPYKDRQKKKKKKKGCEAWNDLGPSVNGELYQL